MRAEIGRKLNTVHRVLEFARANPSRSKTYQALVDRLEERSRRSDQLDLQQKSGRMMERGATIRKHTLRMTLQGDLVPHLIKVGRSAVGGTPQLAAKFTLPRSKAPDARYLSAVREMVGIAREHLDEFTAAGLEDGFLDDLQKVVDEFGMVVAAGQEGRRDHVGARADLEAVTRELMDTVRLLDTQCRYRFRNDSELKAAWRSVQKVQSPPIRKPRPESANGTGGAPPTEAGSTPGKAA